MVNKLRLTRQQLSSFLTDHESIKQFESLFSVVDEFSQSPPGNIDTSAENANSKAQKALDILHSVQGALEYIDSAKIPYDANIVHKTWDEDISGDKTVRGSWTFTAINPITTAPESWMGPSAATGLYFKSGFVGVGVVPTNRLTVGPLGDSIDRIIPTLRVQGMNVSNGADGLGQYGGILLHATSSYSATARRFLVTNAYDLNKYAIIRSVDAATDPTIGVAGAVSSGTVDFYIDNTGKVWVPGANSVAGLLTSTNVTDVTAANTGAVQTLGGVYAAKTVWGATAHFGGAADYTSTEADGTVVFSGAATVWDDIQFPVGSGKVPAAGFPTWGTITAPQEGYSFDVGDSIQLETQEPPHGYKEGSTLYPHIHWKLNGAAGGTARKIQWRLDYEWWNANSATSTAGNVVIEVTTGAADVDKQNYITSFPTISGAGMTVGAQIMMRLSRIAKSAGGSDPVGDPWPTQVGIHVELDTVGSRTVTAK